MTLTWRLLVALSALLAVAMLLGRKFPYWTRVWRESDVWIATVLGGPEGVTLSGWLGVLSQSEAPFKRVPARAICRALDLIEKAFGGDGRHCEGAIVPDAKEPLPVAMVLVGIITTIVVWIALWKVWIQ